MPTTLRITTTDSALLAYLQGNSRPVQGSECAWTLVMDPYQPINLMPSVPVFFESWTLADSYRFNPRYFKC